MEMSVFAGSYLEPSCGKWLNISEFDNAADLYKKGQEVAKCEEVLWADWEGFPCSLWGEYGAEVSDFWEAKEELEDLREDEIEAFESWWSFISPGELSGAVEKFRDSYMGEFNSLRDFGYQIAEDSCLFEGASKTLVDYFDYEGYANDLIISGDYYEDKKHYFLGAC